MPQITITVVRPEVSVSTTQTGPSVTINESPIAITQNTSTIAVTSTPHVVTVNTAATTIQTTTLDEAFQGEYSPAHTYHRGDLVRYEQSVYVYTDTTPRTTAAPDVDTDYWVLLFSETGLTGQQVAGVNRAINLTTWDPVTEYSIGDIVFLRQDYEIDVGVTVPYYTMYRLYHISGSINVNPFTHSYPPSIVDDVVSFDENSAWQNLSGVRSINGFSGDVSLQEILDASSLALNTSSLIQGSNENHGSFESHADSVYLYGDALYIGQSTSTADVGFLLSNTGGSALVVIDAATGKLKFSNDLTNYYNLPTSTDDLAEGSTNLYYTTTRANSDFDTRLVTKTTSNLTEGTNLYYTTSRANTDFDTRLATKTTTNLAEGTNKYYTDTRFDDRLATKTTTNLVEGTNLYYTDGRFDTRLATKDTDDLAEGANLYYTTTRANTDFDARLGTKTTTNLTEGSNLYYTTSRANSDFDTRLATKSTTNLAEGTNQYFTNTRARGAVSGSTGISYNNTTGAISIDDTVVATHTYVGTQIANLVDSSPSTLDTLNELAAALGDDPNFATTTATAIGTKLATADFTSTANTWLGTKSTTNLSEGTNQYFTTTRARGAFSAGTNITIVDGVISAGGAVESVNSQTGVVVLDTDDISEGTTNQYYTNTRSRSAISVGYTGISAGLTYNSSTGVLTYMAPGTDDVPEGIANQYFTNDRARSAVANGVDLAVNGSNDVYVKSIRDATRLKGAIEATQNASYVFAQPALTATTGNNGFDISSSTGGANGYGAQCSLAQYFGDTLASTNTSAAFAFKTANGTSATTGTNPLTGAANTGPTANLTNNTLGTINFNGYGTTDFVNQLGSRNQGGGLQAQHAVQVQVYAKETFADAITTVTPTSVTRGSFSITSLVITGTKGQFSCAANTFGIGQAVRITGTLGGTGSISGYTGDNTYYIIATNNSTTFTLSSTINGSPIDTTAGTPTGLTVTRNIVTLVYTALTAAPFTAGGLIQVSGITGVTDGTYGVVSSSTTQTLIGAVTTSVALGTTPVLSIRDVTAVGTGFRVRGYAAATKMLAANRINYMDISPATSTFKSDQYNFQGGTNTFNYLTANAAAVTAQGSFVVKDLTGATTYLTVNSTGTIITATDGQNLTNSRNYVMGAIRNSTTASTGDIWALNSTGAVTPFRGVSLDNSADTTRGPGTVLRSFSGGAVTGNPTRGRVLFEKARGTSAAPTAIQAGDFLGSVDATGYTSTGWLNDNISAVTPAFFGFVATENWVSNTNIGTSFALSLAPTATTITSSANLITALSLHPSSAAHRADTYTFGQGKSGTATYLSMDSAKITASIPIAFPVKTAAQWRAITGAVGWQVCVSDSNQGSNPGGMMAYWDTTNSRWSYVHDNSAV